MIKLDIKLDFLNNVAGDLILKEENEEKRLLEALVTFSLSLELASFKLCTPFHSTILCNDIPYHLSKVYIGCYNDLSLAQLASFFKLIKPSS